jgi:hypothetical protein
LDVVVKGKIPVPAVNRTMFTLSVTVNLLSYIYPFIAYFQYYFLHRLQVIDIGHAQLTDLNDIQHFRQPQKE